MCTPLALASHVGPQLELMHWIGIDALDLRATGASHRNRKHWNARELIHWGVQEQHAIELMHWIALELMHRSLAQELNPL